MSSKIFQITKLSEYLTEALHETLDNSNCQFEEDNEGQLIIYTGIYRWKDGSYRNRQEIKEHE